MFSKELHMKKEDDLKERLMLVTTDLIQASNGNMEEITTRMITEKAKVGIGLINYHFGTKDNLIELCVQRIIETVITSFKPNVNQASSPTERLKYTAKLVADFLVDNPAVARISIIGDYRNPKILDNTMKTVFGFSNSLRDLSSSEQDKKLILFSFTSILQATFLRKEISKDIFGFDFNIKEERDKFIDDTIDTLLGGNRYEDSNNKW